MNDIKMQRSRAFQLAKEKLKKQKKQVSANKTKSMIKNHNTVSAKSTL